MNTKHFEEILETDIKIDMSEINNFGKVLIECAVNCMDVIYEIKDNKLSITKLMKPYYIDEEEDKEYFLNLYNKLKHIANLTKGTIRCSLRSTRLEYVGNRNTSTLYSKANLNTYCDDYTMVLYDDAEKLLLSDINNESIQVIKFFDLFNYVNNEFNEDVLDMKHIEIGCMNNGIYFKMNNELYKLYMLEQE